MNPNLVQVWPLVKVKKVTTARREYVDSEGNAFSGTHREAYDYYRELHPTKSLQVHVLPKKRKSH